ncbi:hypothetical protein MKZ38_005935 [Zalerion maritima]|uniref:CID domain-containing protein n=1 Tax=Zalerion maritima TaxID=339359 RepID=A0AAD5RVQ7_9PEZI|nr:hypothetical protein MKZ38_005935 [Zalerion maritima]
MAFNADSDEMADNFRQALEDMTGNTKHEINNLTLIARESTEHAHSIADVIMDHILKVAPQKKLASLYVLDSIVKNVGSPYNLFFSRNLYKVFMESYAIVDQQTRRKMEELFKTWKESVPGSIDRRPVFEPDILGPIDTTLDKVRGGLPQHLPQGHHAARRPPVAGPASQLGYRETPTPPQPGLYGQSRYPPPSLNGGPRQDQQFPVHPAHAYPTSHSSTSQGPTGVLAPYPPPGHGIPHGAPPQPTSVNIKSLSEDISQLVGAMRVEAGVRPYETSIQTKMGALQDLQTILQSQQDLPQDQLVLVKNQVSELAKTIRATLTPVVTGPPPPPASTAGGYYHTSTPPVMPTPQAHHAQYPPPRPHIPPHIVASASATPPQGAGMPVPSSAAPSKLSLASLLGPGAMAAIMKSQGQQSAAKTQTPPPPRGRVAIHSPPAHPPQPQQAPKPEVDPMALIGMLRNKGMIGKPAPVPVPPRNPKTLEEATIGLEMKSSSLKQFRPYMSSFIYDKLGPQCSQCGRRFTRDEEGKAKKMAHMDWHFKVYQRIQEGERRGQHLSWYVDEMEWIRWEESIDADHHGEDPTKPDGDKGDGLGKAGSKQPKDQWIRVPDDAKLKASVCPICQETFQMSWLHEAQEFVWMDAVKVSNRVYHATCHAEAFKDREKSPLRQIRGTPEPVLGKRKAEDEYLSRSKIRLGSVQATRGLVDSHQRHMGHPKFTRGAFELFFQRDSPRKTWIRFMRMMHSIEHKVFIDTAHGGVAGLLRSRQGAGVGLIGHPTLDRKVHAGGSTAQIVYGKTGPSLTDLKLDWPTVECYEKLGLPTCPFQPDRERAPLAERGCKKKKKKKNDRKNNTNCLLHKTPTSAPVASQAIIAIVA